ncbi:MAG: SOS cell division inhibitor SulA [Pseudomonadales bacterium]|nr:SOS cell division inhibitor SulA [Pseudomonadales bacterium]
MTAPKPHLQSLLRHPAIWRAADAWRAAECREQGQAGISTGYHQLDQALPEGGWPAAGIAELLCAHWGCGEAELLASMLQQQSRQARWLVWVNPPWIPYAPALVQQGIALENTLFLRCNSDKDVLWAMEQCLVSGSCSVVQGWPAHPQPQQIRRLQLAAQKGHSLGILLRPSRFGQQPSPAPLRLELGPLQQALQVRIVKCQGRWGSGWLRLQPAPPANTETGSMGAASLARFPVQPVPAASQLQHPPMSATPTVNAFSMRLTEAHRDSAPLQQTTPANPRPSGG